MADEPTQRINKRLSEGLDSISERIDAGFASVRAGLDDMAEHVRKVEARTNAKFDTQDATLTREFSAIEIGIGELRDRVKHLEDETLPRAALAAAASAAEGAAKGAGEAAGAVAANAARITADHLVAAQRTPFLKTVTGKVVIWSGSFTAVMTALAQLPGAVKTSGLFLAWIAGLAK
jgi:hypothetical protein